MPWMSMEVVYGGCEYRLWMEVVDAFCELSGYGSVLGWSKVVGCTSIVVR